MSGSRKYCISDYYPVHEKFCISDYLPEPRNAFADFVERARLRKKTAIPAEGKVRVERTVAHLGRAGGDPKPYLGPCGYVSARLGVFEDESRLCNEVRRRWGGGVYVAWGRLANGKFGSLEITIPGRSK